MSFSDMNSSERRLNQVIDAAVQGHVLDKFEPRYSLRIANMALHWFVQHPRWITDLTVTTLRRVAALANAYPQDWRERARAELCNGRDRDIEPVWPIPLIVPTGRPHFAWENTLMVGRFPFATSHLPPGCIDLICFSPPYAEQRSRPRALGQYQDGSPLFYEGVPEKDYAQWMVGCMREADRLLGEHGSVIFVLAPHMRDGAYVRYVIDTICALLDDGWRQVAPAGSPWIKRDAPPVGRADRQRVGHEGYFWLTKRRDPYSDTYEGGRHSDRIGKLHGYGTMQQPNGKTRSGIARVTTVADFTVGGIQKRRTKHPARHPIELYEYFIRLACPPDGIVADVFAGSGTTLLAAIRTGRRWFGVEAEPTFVRDAQRELSAATHPSRPAPAIVKPRPGKRTVPAAIPEADWIFTNREVIDAMLIIVQRHSANCDIDLSDPTMSSRVA
jgi:DNA modification methylase